MGLCTAAALMLTAGVATVRDMAAHEQREVPLGELVEELTI